MAGDWTCTRCNTKSGPGDRRCDYCGFQRPDTPLASEPSIYPSDVAGGRCPFDGSALMANGWCETGDGFPITRAVCPDVCDRCRKPLTWAGTCLHCTAYAPGNRYEYTDKNPHWQLVEKGPFVILPPQQQAHRAAEFADVMTRLVAGMALRETPTRHQGERS